MIRDRPLKFSQSTRRESDPTEFFTQRAALLELWIREDAVNGTGEPSIEAQRVDLSAGSYFGRRGCGAVDSGQANSSLRYAMAIS